MPAQFNFCLKLTFKQTEVYAANGNLTFVYVEPK